MKFTKTISIFSLPSVFFLCGWILFMPTNRLAAQALQVTNAATAPFTPTNLITNIFLGDGVEVTNITYGGENAAIGYFNGGTNAIGLDRGIIMTSGFAANPGGGEFGAPAVGDDFADNTLGSGAMCPELEALATNGLNDVAVYTITFIPVSDTLRFRYCFASEEYPEFACTQFNDVFGFFIQGPNYPTFTNIAIVPTTNLPVSINNIHPPNGAGCPAVNQQYYNNNNNSNNQPVYDGFTDVFTAEAIVVPCQSYTIKLAIADVGDSAYDSGVFLEAKSFGTGTLNVAAITVSNDGTITEGCSEGILTFSLPVPAEDTIYLDYNIWGTATNGLDYLPVPIDTFFAPGQDSITILLTALEDNISDNNETFVIDIQRDVCNRDTFEFMIRENTMVAPMLPNDTTLCLSALPITLNGTAPVPLPPAPTFSNMVQDSIFPVNTPLIKPINVSGVQPATLYADVIQSVCMNIKHPFDDDLDVYLIAPDGKFVELTTDNGAQGDNYTNTCFTETAPTKVNFPGPFAPASATPFTGNFLPEGLWSDLYGAPTNGTWKLQMIDDANGFAGRFLDWTITFFPSYRINYEWTPSAGLSCSDCPITIANPTQPTTYIVRATDTYGCEKSDTITINVLDALLAPVVTCGSLSPTSATFSWTPVAAASTYQVNVNGQGWIDLPAGTLTYTATGFPVATNISIEVRGVSSFACPAAIGTSSCMTCASPVASALQTPLLCHNSTNASITVNTDNLNPPYEFSLNNGTPNQTGVFNTLGAGTYTIAISDNSGCSTSITSTIVAPDTLKLAAIVVDSVDCHDGSNAILTATHSGGTGVVAFQWNATTTADTIFNQAPGVYQIQATDANGCTASGSITLPNPSLLMVSATPTPVVCFGESTGSAIGTASGGDPNYAYQWSNQPTSGNVLTGVPIGDYVLTATDAKGCIAKDTVTITQPAELVLDATSTAVNCFGTSTGTATVIPTGGTGTYTYSWNTTPIQTTVTATNLAAQPYMVVVTDQNQCSRSFVVTPSTPTDISLQITQTDALCFNESSGTATVTAQGGVGNFTYLWSTMSPQTTATATALLANNYQVIVTDGNGCQDSISTTIGQPTELLLSLQVENVNCIGSTDGDVVSTTAGGTPPYNYAWTGGATTPDIIGVAPGIYLLTLTDALGCSTTEADTIFLPDAIVVNLQKTDLQCFNTPTGAIVQTTMGGTGNFQYQWTGPNGFTSGLLSPSQLYAGTYSLTVLDANGCSENETVTLTEPPLLTTSLPAVSDSICFNLPSGTATVIAGGGVTPYTYAWSSGNQSDAQATNLSGGIHSVSVTDANGCIRLDTAFIYEQPLLELQVNNTLPLCHDGDDATATIIAANYGAFSINLSDLTYQWNTTPAQSAQTVNNLQAATNYILTATDILGCTGTYTVNIGNQPELIPFIQDITNVLCFGDATGSATVSVVGGNAPYTYLWSPDAQGQTTAQASQLQKGSYAVMVTDNNNCTATAQTTITEPTELRSNFLKDNVKCYGGNDGDCKVNVSGGVGPYQYLWSNTDTLSMLDSLLAGIYTITITDRNGCKSVDNVTIAQPDQPLSGATTLEHPLCHFDKNGRIIINGSGGTPPYSYHLDDKPWNGTATQIGLSAGIYTPYLKDANGCLDTLDNAMLVDQSNITLDLGPDFTLELGHDTILLANVTNGIGISEYFWSAEDSLWLSCMDCPTPNVDSLFFQNTFELYVIDELGCVAEDFITIYIDKPRRIHVPTGFSPNNDFENDQLFVHGQEGIKIRSFQVFDRWGGLVHEDGTFYTNDIAHGWDGTYRGQPADPTVYVWVLQVEYMDGVQETFKGNTTLIR